MKTIRRLFYSFLPVLALLAQTGRSDTLLLQNGSKVSGTILQTNDDKVLLLTSDAAFNFKIPALKEVQLEQAPEPQPSLGDKFLDFRSALIRLSKQPWAANLVQIPATVIEKGVLRNVPYSSFRCGEDYEFNVYGDLEHPAGIEIGVYRKLLDDNGAKSNCLNFISSLLIQQPDKLMLQKLILKSDYQVLDDVVFEVSPPTEPDSFNGWWVSIYFEEAVRKARATDQEMKQLTLTKAEAPEQANDAGKFAGWSSNELKLARSAYPTRITFMNSTGTLVSNAEVVRVIDGVSIIYRNGPTSGGMVRIADLPESLRKKFGFDPVKTEVADSLARQQKAQWQQQVQQQASQAALAAQYASPYPQYFDPANYSGSDSASYHSSGGPVYVHGYSRKNGTYVSSYTRSSPH